jgi:Sulfotransferase domain
MLGHGRCYHMFEVRDHPAYVPLWNQVADGRRDLWDTIFDGYSATVDWPGCRFWRELMDYYPAAKVVLTARDPDRWYKSVSNTIYPWLIKQPSSNDQPGVLERRAMATRSSPSKPSMGVWVSVNTRSGSLNNTSKRSVTWCRPSACWFIASPKAGSRSARSWNNRFLMPSSPMPIRPRSFGDARSQPRARLMPRSIPPSGRDPTEGI